MKNSFFAQSFEVEKTFSFIHGTKDGRSAVLAKLANNQEFEKLAELAVLNGKIAAGQIPTKDSENHKIEYDFDYKYSEFVHVPYENLTAEQKLQKCEDYIKFIERVITEESEKKEEKKEEKKK